MTSLRVADGIPKGSSCYEAEVYDILANRRYIDGVCPYWGSCPDKSAMTNGYCNLTGKKDWQDGTSLWNMDKCCGENL